MADPLVRALERFGPLPETERRSVERADLAAEPVEADRDLLRGGERPPHVALLVEGWACRGKTLADGRRQITAFHVPGDLCDLAGLCSGRLDQGTHTLTPARVVLIPRPTLLDWMRRHPCVREALWRAAGVDAAISREWIVNVGRRTVEQRTAHLLCELVVRLHAAGPTDGACGVPLGWAELADALGSTPVHVNRALWRLRAAGLVERGDGVLLARDWDGLRRAGAFDAGYLDGTAAA